MAGVSRDGSRTVQAAAPVRAPQPDGRTLFEIGSITKVFTGTLLAEMHLRDEVELDDQLSRHLPRADAPAWRHREPTLEELATHRSALPNTPPALGRRELLSQLGVLRGDPWGGVTEEAYRAMVRALRPRRAPGARVRYSSVGFGLLGDALACRAGTTFEQLLAERVWFPPRAGGHEHRGRRAGERQASRRPQPPRGSAAAASGLHARGRFAPSVCR